MTSVRHQALFGLLFEVTGPDSAFMGVEQIPFQGRAATLLCSVAARSCAGRPGRPTNLVREGHDIVLVAELMGHARLETTRRYTKPSETDRQTPSIPSPPTDSAAGMAGFRRTWVPSLLQSRLWGVTASSVMVPSGGLLMSFVASVSGAGRAERVSERSTAAPPSACRIPEWTKR